MSLCSIKKRTKAGVLKLSPRLITRMYFNRKTRRKYTPEYWASNFEEMVQLAEQIETISYDDIQKKRWFEDLEKPWQESLPKSAIIEINNNCNIDCLMCKTSLSVRKKGIMKEEVLEVALKRLKEMGYESFGLHTIGDPLANPRLEAFFKVFRKHEVTVGLTSNGLLLHRHIKTMIDYMDICSMIRFSIDGASKEVYEKIRAGGIWERLIENLELAKKHLVPRGYKIQIVNVVSQDNYHEIGRHFEFFRKYLLNPYADFSLGVINSLSPDNRYFDQVKIFREHIYSHAPCGMVANLKPYVFVDGRVSLCCRDYEGSLVIGDIHKQTLPEIFSNNPKLEKLRNAHASGDLKDYPLCSTCYIVDPRIKLVFTYLYRSLLFHHPKASGEFYQEKMIRFREIFSQKSNFRTPYEELLSSVRN